MLVANTSIEGNVVSLVEFQGKLCNTCRKTKAIEKFPLSHGYRCRKCYACRSAQNRTPKARALAKARLAALRCKPEARMTMSFRKARERAAEKGVGFSLDKSWLAAAQLITHCPLTGLPFDYSKATGTKTNPLAPSIDRIDSSKGYAPDNSRIVCWWANQAKSDLSDEQFRNMIFAVVAHNFGARPTLH